MLILSCCCLLPSAALVAQPAEQERLPLALDKAWTVFLGVSAPASYSAIPASLQSSDGAEVLPKTAALADNTIDLAALNGGVFEEKGVAVLYNRFTSTRAGTMRVGVAADYWLEIYVNGKPVYDTLRSGNGTIKYTPDDHPFTFPVKAGTNLFAVRVLAGSNGWRFVCGVPTLREGNIVFEADDQWRPVDLSRLQIEAGSALDQGAISALRAGRDPFGRPAVVAPETPLSRLAAGPTGRLVFEDEPDTPVRLRGFAINPPWVFGRAARDPNWKQTWREQAVTARRQGYNLVRTSFKPTYGTEENPISAENLDKIDYLASLWAEHGIYVHFVCTFYQLPDAWHAIYNDERRDYKIRMYLGDPVIRTAWKNGTEFIMNHVNPYTGSAWKDSPGIACVELINEQEWGFRRPERWAPETRAEFDAKFQDWLKGQYGTPARLAAAWGDDSITSFAQAKVPERFPRRSTDTRTNDFFLLCNKLSMDNLRWMKKVLRDVGYKGLVAQYSIPYGFGGMLPSFEESQVAIVNTYYRHPSAWTAPGSRTDQRSSVGVLGDYWRNAAARRFADRPLFITEFNHSFWNPYQHEGGLVFGAYSALQGFDTLVIHAGSAYFAEGDPVDSFSVGRSPVLRANEFLLNCLFLRRDVAPSPRRVEIDVPEDYMKTDCNSGRLVSTQQSRIALMCGLTVNYPWAERPEGVGKPAAPSAVLSPGEGAELRSAGGGWAVESVESGDATFSLKACVAALKARGILPTSNVSDPDNGVYQSDTGEIIIRASENLLKVVTPRSEAVALESGKGEPLGQLTVTESSVPALVAACAVDDEALEQSRCIVLIYSTEVVNTGMELSPDRTMLVQLGEQPVLMKVGRLRASLRNANGASMSLYALGLDGSRTEKLPLEAAGDLVRIQLDTAALRHGPTPFFELVAEE